MAYVPPKPQPVDAHSAEHGWILNKLTGVDPLIAVQSPLVMELDKTAGIYKIKLAKQAGADAGGFQGEYDPTQAYAAGDWFKISTALAIRGATVAAGVWAVRPAKATADTQGFGPWAGQLPANPATLTVDVDKLFFNPENTAPTMGAAPNDKLYAELVNSYC